MKIIYFLSLITPIFSLIHKHKLCIDCKYYIPDHDIGKYSKCALFPKKEGKINYLVNGINSDYYYCSTIRDIPGSCGEEGKYYKKKK